MAGRAPPRPRGERRPHWPEGQRSKRQREHRQLDGEDMDCREISEGDERPRRRQRQRRRAERGAESVIGGTIGDHAGQRRAGARLRRCEGGLDVARRRRANAHHQLPEAPPPPDEPPPPENPPPSENPPPPPDDQPPVLNGTIHAPPVRRAPRFSRHMKNRMNRNASNGATKSPSEPSPCGFISGFQSALSVVSAVTMSSTALETPPS